MTEPTISAPVSTVLAAVGQLAAAVGAARDEYELGRQVLAGLVALPGLRGGWLELDATDAAGNVRTRPIASTYLPAQTDPPTPVWQLPPAALDPVCRRAIPLLLGAEKLGTLHLLTTHPAAPDPVVMTACQSIASAVAVALAGLRAGGQPARPPAAPVDNPRAAQRRRELVDALHAIYAGSGYLVAVVDAQGVYTVVDVGVWLAEGQEILHRLDQLAPDARARFEQALAHALAQHQRDSFEYQDPGGTWWWVRARPIPLETQVLALVLVSDITERKLTESLLIERELRFRAIFNTQYQYIGLLHPDGTMLEANESALRFGGLTRDAVVGKPLWDTPWWRVSEQARAELVAAVARAAQGEFVRYEVEVAGQGQTTAIVDFSLTPVRDETGRVVLLIPEGRDITEMKRTEEQLRFQARILNQITDAIVATDMEERVVYWGSAAEKMYGLPAAAAIGQKLTDCYLTVWESPAQYTESFQTLVEHGVWRGVVTQELRDGRRVPVEGLVSLYRATDGSPMGMLAVLHDITLRRQMEAELHASRERFRTSLENLLDSFGIYTAVRDPQGKIVDFEIAYVNQAACESMHLSYDQMVGQRLLELLPTHQSSGLFDLYAQVVETGDPLIRESFRMEDMLNGRPFHMIFDVRAFKLEDGFAAVWRDVTTREQAAQALRTSEERLALALDVTGAGIFDFHLPAQDGDYYSPSFWRMLGYAKSVARTGDPILAWLRSQFHPDDVAGLNTAMAELIDGTRLVANLEARIRHRDGHWVYGQQVATAAERDERGRATRLIGLQLDISQRKEIELELRRQTLELARSNADLEQFAYIASHDLQEPLRMVSSYVQLLTRRYDRQLDGEAREFIAYIQEGTVRMQTLIKALLAYSRVSTQGQPFQPVELEGVLRRVLHSLQWSVDEAKATVTGDPLPTVMGDEVQLGQVLHNLLVNAVKFRRAVPPDIQIRVTPLDTEWRFGVSDNGIGIDPKFAERIFVIFQRLHTQEEYPGTGIGLALCKKIVERHGGRIWAESQPGQGTTIYFTLPRPRV